MKNKQMTIKEKGFTLAELLVSVSVFAILIGGASGAFVSTIQAQRKSLAFQELLAQTSYLEEYMSRAIRMGKKDIAGTCITAKSNYDITRSDNGIKFKFMNYKEECQEFYLSDSKLWENKNGDRELSSSQLNVEIFNIQVSGNSQTDSFQPRVTLFLKIKGAGLKPEQQPEIKIQTTISQRNLDVQY